MRKLHLFAVFCLCHAPVLEAQKLTFGNPPEDKSALALRDRIVERYRSQGIPAALRMLDEESPKFLAGAGATARYDFYSALNQEALNHSGREDSAWDLALIEWCYNHCRHRGESYWYGRWVSMMHERYFAAGRYREARGVIEYERIRRIEAGKELDLEKLASDGPVHSEFPAIRKRKLGPEDRIMIKDYSFFVAQAEQEIMEGKWRWGMEASALAASTAMGNFKWSQARPENTDSKLVMADYTGHWRNAKWLSASGFRFLGIPELELKECEELSEFHPEEGRGIFKLQMARARAAHLRYSLGRVEAAAALKTMGEIRAIQRSDAYKAEQDADLVYLMVADTHFRQGNAKRGWEVIGEIRAKADLSRDMRFQVDSEWCRHRVETAEYEGVEAVLIGLLKTAREGGLKQREIGLYETYAKLLIGLGRYGDALVIQRELIRLLRSFDLFPRVPAALWQLAGIHALLGERDLAAAAVREANRLLEEAKLPDSSKQRLRVILAKPLPDAAAKKPDTAKSDLQPLRSMMIPLEGFPARGLFTLTNHSGNGVSGELRFKGAGLAFRGGAVEGMVGVDVAAPGGGGEITRKVSIAAGDFLAIDLSRHPVPNAARATVAITWLPAGGEPQTAEWIGDGAEEGVSLAVTDAGEYLDNPFYLIPIYHLLQYKDAFAQVADVRVVASRPTRIELYDQNDELVLVDADGDGTFRSEGDMISKDLNRNGAGDMVLEATAKERRFRLFVRPAEALPGGELSLDIQLFQQGEWVTHSTDRILFKDKGK
jgi:hypothetical protein